jgi:hypothetical protein
VDNLTSRYNAAREHARLEVERVFKEQFFDNDKEEYEVSKLTTTIAFNKWQMGKQGPKPMDTK